MTTGHTAAILDFAHAPHALPDAVRADALRLLADTLAVGAAGAASDAAERLLSALYPWGKGGTSRLFCIGKLTAPTAAFFNGFAIHCLEWDAVHEPAVVHALSVVTAALLADGDAHIGHGVEDSIAAEEFLTALAVGVDIACGLGIAATGPMRFFRPATAGVIGAALAVARLAGLSRDRMADVLGLAYSFAGGTMQAHVEGSIALPLQIGRAAQAAVEAVQLVRAGMSAPHDVLEGPFGYAALIEPLDLARYTTTLGQVWRISEISVKPYPSGRASHGVLATLAELRQSERSIAGITAHVPPLIHRLVGRPYHSDMTPAYARLCLPLLCALMLRDGRIDPRRFTLESFADTEIRALAAKVAIVLDDNPDGNALSPQHLVIRYADGSSAEIPIPHTLGSPDAPLSTAQFAQKYDLCRVLAPQCDPRIFDDPLAYATEPA
jgi:2-methylcitrate dehydratase PrpD